MTDITDIEKLVLAIVRTDPNRLLQHTGCSPCHKIAANDIASVSIITSCRNDSDYNVKFTFDEKSQAVLDIRNEQYYIRHCNKSISESISFYHIPIYFQRIGRSIEYSRTLTKYVCFLAKCFMNIDANSLDEVKVNLVLMGRSYEDVSEAA